jgi:hypothetical protein
VKVRSLSIALFFVAHSVSATILAFVLAMIFGGLNPAIAGFSLAFSMLRARRFVRTMQNSLEWRAPEAIRSWSAIEIGIFGFVMFASYKHFGWLMPTMPGGTITTLSATNYGDLPLHLNYIRALASGIDFLPVNPIYALEPLRYPFGPDLYNALWEAVGIQTTGHLFLTGLAATFASLVLLRELGGPWAMAAFFLAGGSVVADTAASVDWKSLFLAVWITQRGMLWAIPIGVTLLLYLRSHLSQETRLPRKAVSGLGRMWGAFPLFHAHSFIVVSLLLFFLTWRDFGMKRTRVFFRRFFIENRALAWAFLPAAFLIYHTSAGFSKASIVHFRPLWLAPEQASAVETVLWIWRNFGLALASLTVVGLMILAAEKYWLKEELAQRSTRSFFDEVLILVSFFVIFLFVMLAPWEWDNVKVLVWPWLLLFARAGRSISRLAALRPTAIWPVMTSLALIAAFSPGIAVIAKSWTRPQEKSTMLWSIEQLAYSEAVLLRVPRKAVFAASPSPIHVLTYFGRVRAVGYAGHLWSHAINSGAAEKRLEFLMNGTEGWVEAAKELKVTHIYWGPEERSRWGDDPKVWQSRLPMISKAGDHEVYEFKETR